MVATPELAVMSLIRDWSWIPRVSIEYLVILNKAKMDEKLHGLQPVKMTFTRILYIYAPPIISELYYCLKNSIF